MSEALGPLLDAIDLAVIASDRDGNITYWSRGATKLYGWTAEECLGRPVVMVTPAPDSREAAERILLDLQTGSRWVGMFPVRRKDGSVFEARVTLAALWDDAGHMAGVVGVSEDVTTAGQQERDLVDRTERLELALESGRMGTWRWDADSGLVSWDATIERIFDLQPGGFAGTMEAYSALIHPDDREATLATVESSMATLDDHEVEHRFIRADGSVGWLGGTGRVVLGPDGVPTGMIGVAADITARKEADAERAALLAAEQLAHAKAEAAGERLAFLSEVGALLAETLDYDETLQRVADLIVSVFADWCTIDLLDDDTGTIRRAVVAHSAAAADSTLAAEMAGLRPQNLQAPGAVAAVIRTGEPTLHTDVSEEHLKAGARDQRHHDLLRALGMRSSVIVPLIARGRTTGALTMVSTVTNRRYSADDLQLAMELARRAAIAIDNSRLFAERVLVAETLQRSLLPPVLPDVTGVQIAARYRPAQRGLDIGGDFYDVFPVAAGAWCIVMGDVCGKGAAAAALTGAVRWTVRAVATRQHDPRSIIKVLNETLLAEQSHHRFCTIIVAIATVEDDGVHLSVANGGHPLPLVRRAAGGVERGTEGGMLVGALREIDVALDEIELHPGDALLLYTDGVTETRSGLELYGEERLIELLGSLDTWSASATAEAIEAEVTSFQTGAVRDDLALLVIRAPNAGDVGGSSTQDVAIGRTKVESG
ncbi:MAG: SpoIIE family protein phosphatase [Mycobacteriales bacterium]